MASAFPVWVAVEASEAATALPPLVPVPVAVMATTRVAGRDAGRAGHGVLASHRVLAEVALLLGVRVPAVASYRHRWTGLASLWSGPRAGGAGVLVQARPLVPST